MKNIDLAFVKEKKNLDLYFNKKYGSSFFLREKIQICILMKNTYLVLFKKKKNSDLYFNEKYRFGFY